MYEYLVSMILEPEVSHISQSFISVVPFQLTNASLCCAISVY